MAREARLRRILSCTTLTIEASALPAGTETQPANVTELRRRRGLARPGGVSRGLRWACVYGDGAALPSIGGRAL